MNVIELELAHHHHEELVQEAENERLARGLREDRPPGTGPLGPEVGGTWPA